MLGFEGAYGEKARSAQRAVKEEVTATRGPEDSKNKSLTKFFYDNFPGDLPDNLFSNSSEGIQVPDLEEIRESLLERRKQGFDSLMKAYDAILFMICHYSEEILENKTTEDKIAVDFLNAYFDVAIEESPELFEYMVETFPRRVKLLGDNKDYKGKRLLSEQKYNRSLKYLVQKDSWKIVADNLYLTEAELSKKKFSVEMNDDMFFKYTKEFGEKDGKIIYLLEKGFYILHSEKGSGLSVRKKKEDGEENFTKEEVLLALEKAQAQSPEIFSFLIIFMTYNRRVFNLINTYNPGKILGLGPILTESRFTEISNAIKSGQSEHDIDAKDKVQIGTNDEVDYLLWLWARSLFPKIDGNDTQKLDGFRVYITGGRILGKDVDDLTKNDLKKLYQ